MARVMAGLFTSSAQAEPAIKALKDAGFSEDQIGIVLADRTETVAGEVPTSTGIHMVKDIHQPVSSTESHEATAAGGILGGSVGALLAATGALVIPGVGPFIAGGILATVLGAAAGAWAGALVGLGFSKEEAAYYEREVHAGRVLVTVKTDDRAADARSILTSYGAETEIPVSTTTTSNSAL